MVNTVKVISDFNTTLNLKVAVGATSATLDSATDDDGVALPTGTYILTFDGDSISSKEYIICTLTGTALTAISSYSRQGAVTSGFTKTHRKGATVTITDWGALKKLMDLADGTVSNEAMTFVDLSFTGTTTSGLKVKSLTTTQRDASSNAANGQIIYNSTTGELNVYQGGAWSAIASGSTQADASTTVAGKVEIATSAESIAGTDTGGTGALLSVLPSDQAKNIQSGTFVYGTDVGGDDTYVVALTPTLASYTAGQALYFKPTTTNTGACSVDFGPSVLNIKTKDGLDPQSGVLRALTVVSGHYDGTNFVLDQEDFATTANKGIVEMATDAEVVTGTDETRYVNPKQLKNSGGKSCGQATQTNGSTADLTIAHGLGVTPRLIRMSASRMSGNNNALLIIGSATSTTNESSVYLNASNIGGAGNHATKILYGVNSTPVTSIEADVKTLDATNIVIQWTTMGNPASSTDLIINWEAYA